MLQPELRKLARSLTRREFIARHPHGFLVLHAPDATSVANVFATQALSAALPAPKAREMIALAIAKSKANPFQAHLSLGRARNCDLVVRDASVSKLHARIRIEETTLTLVDAGSQNGTFVNGTRLLPNEAVAVTSDDQLVFGSVPARTLSAEDVYELSQELA